MKVAMFSAWVVSCGKVSADDAWQTDTNAHNANIGNAIPHQVLDLEWFSFATQFMRVVLSIRLLGSEACFGFAKRMLASRRKWSDQLSHRYHPLVAP
jgi:hypothetical protein